MITYSYPTVVNKEAPVDLIRKHMDDVLTESASDDPFYVADIGDVVRQHRVWTTKLPQVKPFYAVKCNPDPLILRSLAKLGTGFDCASKDEIKAVIDLDEPCSIIYANPCKAASHIKYAAEVGVRVMTFDNADELYKIKRNHPNPQLVLRVLTDDSKSLCRFGLKFGTPIANVKQLLEVAKSLELEVIGVSFHVGSGCCDAALFKDAISTAHEAFVIAKSIGFQLTILDIGGGFPGSESHTGVSFNEIVDVVAPCLEEMFPGVTVIAEPGRFFVSSAFTLAVNVHARRIVPDKSGDLSKTTFMYYVNEGVYSSLNCIHFDHAVVRPKVLLKNGSFCHGLEYSEQDMRSCCIWGPTCDSIDLITKQAFLPELNVGDWLYFEWMGAYTVAAATTFNGFAKCHIVWTNTESDFLV